MDKKKSRTKAKKLFTRTKNSLLKSIVNIEDVVEQEVEIKRIEVEKRLKEFSSRYLSVQEEHDIYVSDIEDQQTYNEGTENEWISIVEEEYLAAERRALKFLDKLSKVKGELKVEANTDIDKESIEVSRKM